MGGGRFRGIALAAFGLVLTATVLPLGLQAGKSSSQHGGRRVIRAGPASGGLPYSAGILVGNTLYLAGTIGEDEANNIVPGGIEAETRRALSNVGEVLKAAGMGFQNVTSVTVYTPALMISPNSTRCTSGSFRQIHLQGLPSRLLR